jgi:hypothetical protein
MPSKEEVERTELILHLDPDFYPEVWPCSYLADRLDDIEVHFPIWEHSGLFMEFRSLSETIRGGSFHGSQAHAYHLCYDLLSGTRR